MSVFVDNFPVFRYFPHKLKRNIKLFHVFKNYYNEYTAYCVTNDHKVYGIGETVCQELEELCDKNIDQFFSTYYDTIYAKTLTNQIFSWGSNKFGTIGRPFDDSSCVNLKPGHIEFLDDKEIIQVSNGLMVCLALSSDGVVYGWGMLFEGSLIKNEMGNFVIPMVLTKVCETIKSIHCDLFFTHALTLTGKIFDFGINIQKNKIPRYLIIRVPDEIITDFCILPSDSLNSVSYDNYMQTDQGLYTWNRERRLCEKTDYKNIFEFFFARKRLTYKTVYIKNGQKLSFDTVFDDWTNSLRPSLVEINFNENKSLRSFGVFNDLPQTLKTEIKYFYKSNEFELLVTDDDTVFGRENMHLDPAPTVRNLIEIDELKDKAIEEFYEGFMCMFARSATNQIYSWGKRLEVQLERGIGVENGTELRPGKLEFFDNKDIIKIEVGSQHCLALSKNGYIYQWGYEKLSGCELSLDELDVTPKRIDSIDKSIKFIHSYSNISFAVDIDGCAYFWKARQNDRQAQNDILSSPKKMNVEDVTKIQVLYQENECLILNDSKTVFIYNLTENTIIKQIDFGGEKISNVTLNTPVGLLVYPELYNYLLQSETNVFVFNYEKDEITKTAFTNFYDYLSTKHNKTGKTIYVKSEESDGQVIKFLTTKEIRVNCDDPDNPLELIDENIFDRKFSKLFEIIDVLGEGGFGSAYKVKDVITKDLYAIKKMEMIDLWEYNLSEIKIMSELNSDFVVKYFDSWIEMEFNDQESQFDKFLYIKMELCSENLKKVIDLMNDSFDENFKIHRFFISTELFKELTKCVRYLHSLTPPIIHRDLKPENVLTADGLNGVFLKLCDFNLATPHGCAQDLNNADLEEEDEPEHTRMVGTDSYMAPEVEKGEDYNFKCDIYSLAMIATVIYHFENNVREIKSLLKMDQMDWSLYSKNYLDTSLENNFTKLLETLKNVLQPNDNNPNNRPDCMQLLEEIKEISVHTSILKNDMDTFEKFEIILAKPENLFLNRFFDYKFHDKNQRCGRGLTGGISSGI